jgi:RloB-like protein
MKNKHLADRRRCEPNVLRSAKPNKWVKKRYLIVCEGENTEPSYFKQFKLATATIKTVGEGFNTLSLVLRTMEIISNEKDEYDSVWCVFDRDSFPAQIFNEAIKTAEKAGFQVAYSNQAFEYWLILHFQDHQGGALKRQDYDDKINEYLKPLKCKYDGKKSKMISDKLFELLLANDSKMQRPRVQLAIERAKKVLRWHESMDNSPEKAESSTTVFKLVEEILKFV